MAVITVETYQNAEVHTITVKKSIFFLGGGGGGGKIERCTR